MKNLFFLVLFTCSMYAQKNGWVLVNPNLTGSVAFIDTNIVANQGFFMKDVSYLHDYGNWKNYEIKGLPSKKYDNLNRKDMSGLSFDFRLAEKDENFDWMYFFILIEDSLGKIYSTGVSGNEFTKNSDDKWKSKNYTSYDFRTDPVNKPSSFRKIEFVFGVSTVFKPCYVKVKVQFRNLALIHTDNSVEIIDFPQDVTDVLDKESIPNNFSLSQNYPNPFNPSTTISYQLPNNGFVTLKVYDILGKEVATLVNEQKSAGKYEAKFNASNLTSGTYIYKISAGNSVQIKKMILMK